jgi:hypothetical protein
VEYARTGLFRRADLILPVCCNRQVQL